MEEEAEKYYIIRGLKENRAREIQLQSCSNIEELKEKMKLLDIQEKSKSSKNEVIYPKYPMTRIPYHTNQFAYRQQYGGWNWRNDQSQHPDTITNTRYKVYSPQFPSPYHHPSFSRQRPILYPRNQRFPQRPTVLRPNAPTFYPRQRTQNNNTVFQPHQTGELIIIQGRINFKQVDVLLDTGSRERECVNIIPKNIISQIKGYHNIEYIKTKIATINGEIEVSHQPFEISLKDNEIYPPLEEARKLAKERTEQYYKINKIRYDKKFQEADFKDGDLEMYEEFQYPNTRKLSPPYSGPYTVLRKCSDVLFEIDRPNALNKTDTELVHSVRLRHFHPSENFQLNYIQQNTPNNEETIIKRNILRNTEITEFCLTKLFGEKE
ncbi:retrotransposable element Tf2 protein type 1 [Trichonephila clavipes]|nr:retrotransposable element Tf2 protein type 1 [Trichonephila clavipes]